MVEEARLERLDTGLAAVTDGWFVVNIRDAPWVTNEVRGAACIFESDEAPFPDIGFTLAVLQPGQSGGRYHREANQEDFLVLHGACLLLIEGEERPLKAWDFVHCPPDTEHAFVGAGEGPCAIFMSGARKGWPDDMGVVYPRSEVALRHGAGVETETTSPAERMPRSPSGSSGRRMTGTDCPGRKRRDPRSFDSVSSTETAARNGGEMKGKIVHMEIPAGDTQRAMKFWGELAGWKFKYYGDGDEGAPEYNMFEGEPGGGIYPTDGDKGILVYFETDDIDAELGRIREPAATPRTRCPCRAWAGSRMPRTPRATSSPSGRATRTHRCPKAWARSRLLR